MAAKHARGQKLQRYRPKWDYCSIPILCLKAYYIFKPLLWWRYRDDIFDLWKQGLSALNAFTDYINTLYPTIKFELVYSDSHLNVLDLTLHLVDGYIQTDVYSKPTDSNLYLKPTSAHLSLPKMGIIMFTNNCAPLVLMVHNTLYSRFIPLSMFHKIRRALNNGMSVTPTFELSSVFGLFSTPSLSKWRSSESNWWARFSSASSKDRLWDVFLDFSLFLWSIWEFWEI